VDIERNGTASSAFFYDFWLLASDLLTKQKKPMKTTLAILLWCILFTLCWPIALMLIFLLPLLWLLLLPFRIVGFSLELIFKLISSILLFPFRLLGAK